LKRKKNYVLMTNTTLKLGVYAIAAYLVYANWNNITDAATNLLWHGKNAVYDFQGKSPIGDLKLMPEKDTQGNVRAYLQAGEGHIPIELRPKGVLVGTPEYIFTVLNEKEKDMQCMLHQQAKEEQKQHSLESVLKSILGK